MSGFKVDRRAGVSTVDEAIKMDMTVCLRIGLFKPGAVWRGTMHWTNARSGKEIAAISYVANMRDPDGAWLWVGPTVTDQNDARRDHAPHITIVATRPNFGGLRWWFICPHSGRRVRCLYLGDGMSHSPIKRPPASEGEVVTFASRQALGLCYQSQRESDADRLWRAARNVDAKLGGDGDLFVRPPKPKWMRWRTYWRLCDRRSEAGYTFAATIYEELGAAPSVVSALARRHQA